MTLMSGVGDLILWEKDARESVENDPRGVIFNWVELGGKNSTVVFSHCVEFIICLAFTLRYG